MYTGRSALRIGATARLFAIALTVTVGLLAATLPGKSHAACAAPSVDYGTMTNTLNVASSATYRIWTRMYVPSSTASTYALQVDGSSCFIVGGTNVGTGSWKWVDYQSSAIASKVELLLPQGTHTLKMIGLAPGVKIDRLIATSDLTCVPTGLSGSECDTPSDTTVPTVTITAPAANADLNGVVTVNANATDNVAVTKVDFYANSETLGSDSSAPYSATWDTTQTANGAYTLTAKAYDAAGHVISDTRSVTVSNGDATAPSVPSDVTAKATSYNRVEVAWRASVDNSGLAGYTVIRNGTPIARLSANALGYVDTAVLPETSYSYQLTAVDTAGNTSAASSAVSVKTLAAPSEGQAPSVPKNLNAAVVSSSQINLSWSASADNVGVTGYEVWRQTGVAPYQKVATVMGTNFGDTTLKAYTKYTYYVKAFDAAGNVSNRSREVNATTRSQSTGSELLGTIRDAAGRGIPYAKVSFVINGSTRTYTADSQGKYDIDGLSGGTYELTYQASGYQSFEIQRIITDNARVAQNATLEKQ